MTNSSQSKSNTANCRGAKRALAGWLEQYGSEASDDLFIASIHELLWLDLTQRREYAGNQNLQDAHARHQARLAAAYAEWLRRDTCSPEQHGWPVSSAEAPASTE